MFERFLTILPTMFVACAAGAAVWWWHVRYVQDSRYLAKLFPGWRKELLLFGAVAVIAAPALEEVIFRAPLIVTFPGSGPEAWAMVLYSGMLFGITHAFVTYTDWFEQMFPTQKRSAQQRMQHIAFTGILGIGLGYVAVSLQSLLLPICLHALSNTCVAGMKCWSILKETREEQNGISVREASSLRQVTIFFRESPQHRTMRRITFAGWPGTLLRIGATLTHDGSTYTVYDIRNVETGVRVFAALTEASATRK